MQVPKLSGLVVVHFVQVEVVVPIAFYHDILQQEINVSSANLNLPLPL